MHKPPTRVKGGVLTGAYQRQRIIGGSSAQLSVAFPDIAVLTLQVVSRHFLKLTLKKMRSSVETLRPCPADTWILFLAPRIRLGDLCRRARRSL